MCAVQASKKSSDPSLHFHFLNPHNSQNRMISSKLCHSFAIKTHFYSKQSLDFHMETKMNILIFFDYPKMFVPLK